MRKVALVVTVFIVVAAGVAIILRGCILRGVDKVLTIRYYERRVKSDSGDTDARIWLGNAILMNNPARARDLFKEAIAIDPSLGRASVIGDDPYYGLGMSCYILALGGKDKGPYDEDITLCAKELRSSGAQAIQSERLFDSALAKLDLSGVLYSLEGNKVNSVETWHLGMGACLHRLRASPSGTTRRDEALTIVTLKRFVDELRSCGALTTEDAKELEGCSELSGK